MDAFPSDIRDEGEEVAPPAILELLAKGPGVPVSKDARLEAGWPGRIIHENSLAKAIGRIRTVLEPYSGYRLNAVYGKGYRLECPNSAADSGKLKQSSQRNSTKPHLWLGFAAAAILSVIVAVGMSRGTTAPLQESEEADALMAFISEDLILPTDPYAEVPTIPALRDVVERTAETMDERLAG